MIMNRIMQIFSKISSWSMKKSYYYSNLFSNANIVSKCTSDDFYTDKIKSMKKSVLHVQKHKSV